MNNKLTTTLSVLLLLLTGFIAYRQLQLEKQVNDLSAKLSEQAKTTPATNNAATAEQSPFDKNYVDPLADQLSNSPKPSALTQIKFDKTVHDFGKLNEGDIVKTVFKFKNTGDGPLVIASAVGSCGCTVPQWPKTAIAPGASAEIGVEFDSNHKSGEQSKTVTVTANTTPPTTVLTIRSTVIPQDK